MCTHGSPARRARGALGASRTLQKPRAECLVPGPGADSGPGQAQRGAGLGKDGPALGPPASPRRLADADHPGGGAGGLCPMLAPLRGAAQASARVCPAPTLTAAPQCGPRRTEGGAPVVQGEPVGIGLLRRCRWDAKGDTGKRGVSPARPYAQSSHMTPRPPRPRPTWAQGRGKHASSRQPAHACARQPPEGLSAGDGRTEHGPAPQRRKCSDLEVIVLSERSQSRKTSRSVP